jgi:hypothetical protein
MAAYPELLAGIRAVVGPYKLLIAAVPGLERDTLAFTETNLPKILESVDFLHVMSYDLANRRDTYTDHHSKLDGSSDAIHLYLTSDEADHPRALDVGLRFYVKRFKTAADNPCDEIRTICCRTELMKDLVAGDFAWHDGIPPELADSFSKALKYGEDEVSGGL